MKLFEIGIRPQGVEPSKKKKKKKKKEKKFSLFFLSSPTVPPSSLLLLFSAAKTSLLSRSTFSSKPSVNLSLPDWLPSFLHWVEDIAECRRSFARLNIGVVHPQVCYHRL